MKFPRFARGNRRSKFISSSMALTRWLNEHNGKEMCWVSLYSFTEFYNTKPIIQSAVKDALYVEAQTESQATTIVSALEGIKYNARWTGFGVDFIIPCSSVFDNILDEVRMARKVFKDIEFSINPLQVFLWVNTWNLFKKCYVIPYDTKNDKWLDLTTMSSKPRKVKFNTGDNYIDEYYR